MSKADRIRAVVNATLGKVTKRDILAKCPDISTAMVEMTLKAMLDEGTISKTGRWRSDALPSVHYRRLQAQNSHLRFTPHDGAVLGRLRFIASSCVFILATYDLLQQGNLIVRQFRKEHPPPLCQRADATSASLPAKRRTGRGEGRGGGRGGGRTDATERVPPGEAADGSKTSCRRGACGRHRPFR